jgi:signal transduction histidine kinase
VATEALEPVDVLTGWARVLRGDPDASTRARAADMIERAAAAQARALEPLARGARLRPRLVDMALVVHTALEQTRPAAQARGISVAWSVDPALDLVYGDAEPLEQIVRTMLGNAIDLAPDGARIHAAIEQAGALARLTVCDTADEQGASFVVTLPVTTPTPR